MKIVQDLDIRVVLENELPTLRALETSTHDCPHCGYPVRYPLSVRQCDVEILERLIRATEEVMKEQGIGARILGMAIAKIRAQMKPTKRD